MGCALSRRSAGRLAGLGFKSVRSPCRSFAAGCSSSRTFSATTARLMMCAIPTNPLLMCYGFDVIRPWIGC